MTPTTMCDFNRINTTANQSANLAKTGLLKFGYVANLKTCVSELNAMLPEEEQVSTRELNEIADQATVTYLNKYGYAQDKHGAAIEQDKATLLYFSTGRKTQTGDVVIGWFERKVNKDGRKDIFRGITWGTLADLQNQLQKGRMFRFGELYFDKEDDGWAFLEDIASAAIPETWSFRYKPNAHNHPILKSYIENIYEVLRHETEKGATDKLIFSKDGKHMVFNINLLDKFFHEVLIVAEVRKFENEQFILVNPQRVKRDSDLIRLGFDRNKRPAQPTFFEKVDEVIFQPAWQIDNDFDKFTHIIEDRIFRFPAECQNEPTDVLARKLNDAIKFAVAIAQRNYKFIVPMYRPQTGRIQLLMPIYLNGTYSCKPDFALILTPDRENEFYTPETILPLDAVYQNARLIAKPDDTWLNPDTIL